MSAEKWAEFFSKLGFPAAVAFFVLWRLDSILQEIAKEHITLIQNIQVLSDLLRQHIGKF